MTNACRLSPAELWADRNFMLRMPEDPSELTAEDIKTRQKLIESIRRLVFAKADWRKDHRANLMPMDMPSSSQDYVSANCANSFIERMPIVIDVDEQETTWQASNTVLCGKNTLIALTSAPVTFDQCLFYECSFTLTV